MGLKIAGPARTVNPAPMAMAMNSRNSMAFLVCATRSCAWPSAATILFKFKSMIFWAVSRTARERGKS